MTHVDYDPRVSKCEQKYRKYAAGGVTLGMIVDVVGELFEKYSGAKFVLVESVRRPGPVVTEEDLRAGGTDGCSDAVAAMRLDDDEDRPTTKMYLPGSSAEKAYGWQY